MVKVEKEVAEELQQALENKLEQSTTWIASLENELKTAQSKMANSNAKLKKKRKKLRSAEVLIKDNINKVEDALAQMAEAEQIAELAKKRAESTEQRTL